MSEPELPPDLATLERRLAARPRVEPPADLKARVLVASRAALHHTLTLTPTSRSSEWHTWVAVAATVLLVVNLSMSVAANTDWDFAPDREPGHATATTEQLRALAPELPESELRRQALLARAGADLPRTTQLSPEPGSHPLRQGA